MSELIRRNPKRVQERLLSLRKIVGPEKNPKRRFVSDFDNEEYLEWTPISSNNVDYGVTPLVKGAGRLGELVDWCDDNCKGIYIIARANKIYFEDENDAAMFALVWK
jgi:hypothetical protein